MFGQPRKNEAFARGFFYLPRVTGDGGLYARGKTDYIFTDFFKMLAHHTERPIPPLAQKRPDTAINLLIQEHGLVVVYQEHDGTVYCYSSRRRNRLPEEFLNRLRTHLTLVLSTPILWSDDVFRDPEEATAGEVLFGEPPPRKPTKAQLAKKWVHPDALDAAEMAFLTGKKRPPKP